MRSIDCQKIFNALPGRYLVTDRDFTIVAVSEAMLESMMTKRQDILGHDVFEIFPDNPMAPYVGSVRSMRAIVEQVISTKKGIRIPFQRYDIRRPGTTESNGFQERYLILEIVPLLGEDGEVSFFIARSDDVSEFVLLQRHDSEMRKKTEELRLRAEQSETETLLRAHEIEQTNQRLRQVNIELARQYQKVKELDELKTQFFANISHELRTPLTLTIGPIERALTMESLDDATRGGLIVAARNARSLQRCIEDLLDVAKLEAGNMALSCVNVDIAEIVRVICGYFSSLAMEQEIIFVVETPSTLLVQIDPEKIQSILLNLLSNAFKFVPRGGRIRCSLRHEEKNRQVAIEVADSGPGIVKELREEIFERFHRASEVGKRRYASNGLGLTIARELARLHGGEIVLDEAAEGGARFTVTLPFVPPVEQTSVPLPVEEELPWQKERILDRLKEQEKPLVLVIEDNRDLNEFIVQILATEFRVESALNSAEGLAKAVRCRPDLILTDIVMPEGSGEEFIRQLSSREEIASIPIVVLTAKADDELRMRLLHAGVSDYLPKPFFADELRLRVRNVVETHRAGKRSANLYENLLREKTKADALLTAFESSERISMRFQEAALPMVLPEVEGLRFDAYYRPGPSESLIGGDWYDAFRLPDGRIVVSIGDVAGAGLGAAIVMAALRNVIRGVSYADPDPTMILKDADRILRAEYPDTYVSAFVGIVDPIEGILCYASAGHPSPLLRHPDGTIEELTYTGILLGVTATASRDFKRVEFPCGSLLVLYTDGLIEATRDIAAMEAKLHEVVRDADARRLESFARRIHDSVLTEPAHDDVAILTVQVVAPYIPPGEKAKEHLSRWCFDTTDADISRRVRMELLERLRTQGASETKVSDVETILGELVGNAARYAPGKVEVVVDWDEPAPVLHVRDHGPGFSYTPHLPRDPLAEGGRGLYIVKALAEEYNITSIDDRGSHVRAVLPF